MFVFFPRVQIFPCQLEGSGWRLHGTELPRGWRTAKVFHQTKQVTLESYQTPKLPSNQILLINPKAHKNNQKKNISKQSYQIQINYLPNPHSNPPRYKWFSEAGGFKMRSSSDKPRSGCQSFIPGITGGGTPRFAGKMKGWHIWQLACKNW